MEYFNPRSRTGSDYRFLHSALGRKSDFNPRSRTGSDAVDPRTTTTEVISIHAPARGATRGPKTIKSFGLDFNPRSRTGSDSSRRLLPTA